ncbi:MAG: hypothetical protein KatS3mg040_1080 [Candidatus Kapaibacterium sp.]|nr:MAG: hypothetical protein KatS3mg040_1080 [Candidatus Kapabacteria bacterium]
MEATTISLIRKEAQRWADAQTLPQEIIESLYGEGAFKLFLPSHFGGKEYSLEQAAALYADIAAADGSVGWLVQIGAGGGYFLPSLVPEVAERIFAPREAVIAGSGYPTGIARKVPGGYRVTGSWKYASGAQYATTFTANAQVEDGGGIRAFAFERNQVELIADWDAMGMRATSSWSFRVEDAFVPEQLSFVVGEKVWEPGVAVYNVPFLLFAIVSFGAVVIGLASAFFEEATQALSAIGARERLGRLGALQAMTLDAEREFFEHVRRIEQPTTEVSWNLQSVRMHEGGSTQHSTHNKQVPTQHEQVLDTLLGLIERIYERVWNALPWCGMHVVHEKSRLSRVVRDLLVVRQHELLRRPVVEVPSTVVER